MTIRTMDEIEAARQVILNSNPPKPPVGLTKDQGTIWTRIFMTTEPGWITENQYGLAMALCRHEDAMNKFSKVRDRLYDEVSAVDLPSVELMKELDRASKMIEREVRSYSSLATRLRITNQALRTADVKKPSVSKAPWEVTDDMLVEEVDDNSAG